MHTADFVGSLQEGDMPVSYEDISRATYRIRSGIKRTVRVIRLEYQYDMKDVFSMAKTHSANLKLDLNTLLLMIIQHTGYSTVLSELCDCQVYLKHDFRQFTGSFKERYEEENAYL